MKIIKAFVLSTTVFLLIGASSCAKCKVCTKPGEAETRFCEKDYSTKTQYGLIIDLAEAAGYTCKSSI